METPDIAPHSNYPREEEERISAQHAAAFLSVQFWQAGLVIIFMLVNLAALAVLFGNPKAPLPIWLNLIVIVGFFIIILTWKYIAALGVAVGWSKSRRVGLFLLQFLALLGCVGPIFPWLVQFFAAKTIKRVSVSIVWPFINTKLVHETMVLEPETNR